MINANPYNSTLKVQLEPFNNTLVLNDVIELGGVMIGSGFLVAGNLPCGKTEQTINPYHWPERV